MFSPIDVVQAKQALQHINDASDTALTELRATLEVLRQDGDSRAPSAPAPGIADVDGLLDGVRAAGVEVHGRMSGDLDGVSPEAGLVAYRVLQEALTNVLKHARADNVEVLVAVDDGHLRLGVRDDGVSAPDPPEYGHAHRRPGEHRLPRPRDHPAAGRRRLVTLLPADLPRSAPRSGALIPRVTVGRLAAMLTREARS